MRQLVSLRFLLLALTLLTLIAGSSRAQSGRTRQVQGTKPSDPSSKNSTDPANDPDNQPDRNGLGNGQAETIEGDVLHVNTALVAVPVTVIDRFGKYIPNLHRQDFHIFDEGVEQRIAYFATVDAPFTVALVIDTSGSTHFKLEEIQDAAIAFVHQLEPQDRVMVVSFDDKIRTLSEPTNDRESLTQAIRRTRTGGGTRLYDAVDEVIRQKLSQISGRKAVVLFTDGVDTTSRKATYSSSLREAQESEGAVYTVAYDTAGDVGGQVPRPWPGGRGGMGGVNIGRFPGSGGGRSGGGTSPGEYRKANEYLHELAQDSGGRYYRGDTLGGVSSAFSQIADELRQQYSIGYYPTPVGQPGQRRQIKVRVNQPDLVVKSRDSYIYAQKSTNDKQSNGQQPTGTSPQPKQLTGSH